MAKTVRGCRGPIEEADPARSDAYGIQIEKKKTHVLSSRLGKEVVCRQYLHTLTGMASKSDGPADDNNNNKSRNTSFRVTHRCQSVL